MRRRERADSIACFSQDARQQRDGRALPVRARDRDNGHRGGPPAETGESAPDTLEPELDCTGMQPLLPREPVRESREAHALTPKGKQRGVGKKDVRSVFYSLSRFPALFL